MKTLKYFIGFWFLFLTVNPVNGQGAFFSSTAIRDTVIDDFTETWVFTPAGQSNMLPNKSSSATEDERKYPPGTLQWGRYGEDNNKLIPATAPLQHWGNDENPDRGPGLMHAFAWRMKQKFPHVRLVFVPTAMGATGFQNGRWSKGDDLYEDAILRTNTVLAENPTFKYKGVPWMQGERDCQDSTSANAYEANLTQMISDWREDVTGADETMPFFCGGLGQAYIDREDKYPQSLIVQAALTDLPNNVSCTGFASSVFPVEIPLSGDDTHWGTDESQWYGHRFFEAFLFALTNN